MALMFNCIRQGGEAAVLVTRDGGVTWEPLNPCYRLRNHSPTGFNWGYGGSGPSQLALAICVEVFQEDWIAMRVYQDFKWAFICTIKEDQFAFDSEFVWATVLHELRYKCSDRKLLNHVVRKRRELCRGV